MSFIGLIEEGSPFSLRKKGSLKTVLASFHAHGLNLHSKFPLQSPVFT
jgi:hypothetical protein